MRMRRKKWARPELAVCPYFVKDPTRFRGQWAAQFEQPGPIHLELGCGKGTFAARMAADHSEINYMAIDIKSDILAVARRNVQQVFHEAGRPVDNLKLMAYEIQLIHKLMAPEDTVDRIYINFCNPWPRTAHHKKRLTHPKQLVLYATFLRDGGEIHFKTDDGELFRDSQEYLTQWGFDLRYITRAAPPPSMRNCFPPRASKPSFWWRCTGKGIPTGALRPCWSGFPNMPRRWCRMGCLNPRFYKNTAPVGAKKDSRAIGNAVFFCYFSGKAKKQLTTVHSEYILYI